MSFVDVILNIVALLLWIDWRSERAIVRNPPGGVSLARSLQSTERVVLRPWISLGALLVLLLLRGFFYWNVGTAASWTPILDLGAVSLAWRTDLLPTALLFSLASFILVLFAWLSGLLLLSLVSRRSAEQHPGERFVRFQIGWLDRLPWILKLPLPLVAAALLWAAASPVLVELQMLPETRSSAQVWREATIMGLCAYIFWKWVLIGLFALHLVNTYVYLGRHPLWEYVSRTGSRFLVPLRFLRFGRLDLSPVAGVAVVVAVFDFGLVPLVRQLMVNYAL